MRRDDIEELKLRKAWKIAGIEFRELKKFVEDGKPVSDSYYVQLDIFKLALVRLLECRFNRLTKPQLIEFLGWCGSYRPVQPFIVFDRLYMAVEADKAGT